jgi:isocitrate lyase
MKSSAPDADWRANPRWEGITRPYSGDDVERLRGSVRVEHTIARLGAERLWKLLREENYVLGPGAVTGNQAIEIEMPGDDSDPCLLPGHFLNC